MNNRIVVDPSGAAPYSKYCRSWVFTGATLPARTAGDAAAEWTGTLAPASASEVLNTGDTIIMSASAENGQSHSEIHATTAGTIPTTAQTLIDAWAGSRTVAGGVGWDRDLHGNADRPQQHRPMHQAVFQQGLQLQDIQVIQSLNPMQLQASVPRGLPCHQAPQEFLVQSAEW